MTRPTLFTAVLAADVLSAARARLELAYEGVPRMPLHDALPACLTVPYAVLVEDPRGIAPLPWLAAAAPSLTEERALAEADLQTAAELIEHGDTDGAVRLCALALGRRVAWTVARTVVPAAAPRSEWLPLPPPPGDVTGPAALVAETAGEAWGCALMVSLVLGARAHELELLASCGIDAGDTKWSYTPEEPDQVHPLPTRDCLPVRRPV